jgi:hypothetical protein
MHINTHNTPTEHKSGRLYALVDECSYRRPLLVLASQKDPSFNFNREQSESEGTQEQETRATSIASLL